MRTVVPSRLPATRGAANNPFPSGHSFLARLALTPSHDTSARTNGFFSSTNLISSPCLGGCETKFLTADLEPLRQMTLNVPVFLRSTLQEFAGCFLSQGNTRVLTMPSPRSDA